MNALALAGLKIAILVTGGFEESELTKPREALDKAGAKTYIVAPEMKKVKSWDGKRKNWGKSYKVDRSLDIANAPDYDALLLPGGVMNPDALRINPAAISFIKHFVKNNKPIAVICHGPWTLINADALQGKKITSWPSLELDLKNAGAYWVNEEVVVDGNLVSSRKPEDIPAFNKAMISIFSSAKVK